MQPSAFLQLALVPNAVQVAIRETTLRRLAIERCAYCLDIGQRFVAELFFNRRLFLAVIV
jgi:hypothetical protein